MSCFICNICDQFIDSDFSGCEEDPSNPLKLICLECATEIEDNKDLNGAHDQYLDHHNDEYREQDASTPYTDALDPFKHEA